MCEKLNAYANMNTRNIQTQKSSMQSRANVNTNNYAQKNANASGKNNTISQGSQAPKSGSLMARANMVKQYNEKNNKDTNKK